MSERAAMPMGRAMTVSWTAYLAYPVIFCLSGIAVLGLYYSLRSRRTGRRLPVYRCEVCGRVYEGQRDGSARCPCGQ